MKSAILVLLMLVLLTACNSVGQSGSDIGKRLLIFSKTDGYRHASIDTGAEAITTLAVARGYKVDHTEDSDLFNRTALTNYAAVIFLNTTGDVLNEFQQNNFEEYIQAGGGFVGIHSASDTEQDWPWYGGLVGAYFDNHPKIQEASLVVVAPDHPTTVHLPSTFKLTDEWYNFHSISPDITPVLTLDESSYEGGTHGEIHPMSWYQEYDGGRVFFTGLGHVDEIFTHPLFIKHIEAGIDYAAGF